MNENGKRQKRSAAEKLRIVMTGWDPGVNVAELCRREGIVPTQFYGWKKQVTSSAQEVFAPKKGKKRNSREEKLEAENRRLKAVIAEITAENLELKKGLLE
jgi:transposase-like protein